MSVLTEFNDNIPLIKDKFLVSVNLHYPDTFAEFVNTEFLGINTEGLSPTDLTYEITHALLEWFMNMPLEVLETDELLQASGKSVLNSKRWYVEKGSTTAAANYIAIHYETNNQDISDMYKTVFSVHLHYNDWCL